METRYVDLIFEGLLMAINQSDIARHGSIRKRLVSPHEHVGVFEVPRVDKAR